jgi:hypothetical protein
VELAEWDCFSVPDLIEMMNAGISVGAICDLIKKRLTTEIASGLTEPATN